MNGGLIERQPVDPLSHIVTGALTIGAADDPVRARKEVVTALIGLREGLGIS